ncbi:MAG: hypothetical protein AAGI38_03930 [Bacteroidota bacterium]
MDFLLAILMWLFGSGQATSPQTQQIDNSATATIRYERPTPKTIKAGPEVQFSTYGRPDPRSSHGPIIIIDDTHYRPSGR